LGTIFISVDFNYEDSLSIAELEVDWPDPGQSNADNSNLPKPDGDPSITAPPIKEIPTNN